ncbi:MAG: aminoacyl-tRNA hydrolase [Ignavibacteria bacterium]
MKLIVGLGNPGTKYELTRHNAGYIIIDYVAEYLNSTFKAGKGEYYFTRAKYKGDDIILLKPSTYMNNSGIAVSQFFELHPEINLRDLLIIYDDFQLELGTIRIRQSGSDGGHNGIASIIYHLNTDDFPRMRVGIGKDEVMKKEEFVNFVLSNFDEPELEKIKNMLPVYRDCVFAYIKQPLKSVMNMYNKNFLVNDKPKQSSDRNTYDDTLKIDNP